MSLGSQIKKDALVGKPKKKREPATIIRGVIKTNEYSKRDMMSPSFKWGLARASEKGYRAAFAEFVKELAKHVPHEGATAWFECSNRGHRVFWIPFKGHVTETRLGRDGYSKVPAAGVWLLQDGPEGFMPDRIEAR